MVHGESTMQASPVHGRGNVRTRPPTRLPRLLLVANKQHRPSVFGRNSWLGLGLGLGLQSERLQSFSVWTLFTVPSRKRSEHPEGMPLVTRIFTLREHAWDPMTFSSVNFCPKTRTVQGIAAKLDYISTKLVHLQCLDAIYSANR
jgi:hypothetical protein